MKKAVLQLSVLARMCAYLHAGDIPSLYSAGPMPRAASPAFVSASTRLLIQQNKMKRASSLSSTIEQPDIEKFSNLIYASDDTVQLLRDELKSRLINAADDFKTMKAQEDAITQSGQDFDEKMNVDVDSKEKDRGYIFRLLSKIVRKISRSKKNYSDKKNPTQSSQGILTSGSFRQIKLEVGAAGEQVLSLAEQLSLLNPTPIPTLGFKHYGGVPPTDSKLAGSWKLRFTTAADASFSESEKRGVVTTSQMVDAEEGTLTNVVDFEKGKLKGFRVVVEGEPTSSTDIDLSFKAVKILRNSRFPRLFGQLSFRLPSRLIRWLASRNKIEEERGQGPSLRMRYLDDDLRMHTTDSGNWFIQTRLD